MSAQYAASLYTRGLAEDGPVASAGSPGESYAETLAQAVTSHCKTKPTLDHGSERASAG